jgi:flavin-dependent dehydrogenase
MSRAKEELTYQRKLEVRHDVDVLVVGGGPAGIAASLAASRQGASVRLIEAQGMLGGMGTSGLVPCFPTFSDGVNFLPGGIGREVLTALQEADACIPPDGTGFRVEVLKRIYDDMLAESDVGFTFHTQLVDMTATPGHACESICYGKSGLFAIRAKMFVDCTGDGDLAAMVGAPFEKGDAEGCMMPGTLCSLWSGVDWKTVWSSGLGHKGSRIEEAIKDGIFTLEDRHLPGMWEVGQTLGGGNIGHTFGVDGTDEESLTKAYLWGRKSLHEYETYYKNYLKGFESMELAATATLMGIRETRRITGDYELTLEDYQNRAVFEDEIGRWNYPVDIHIMKPDNASYNDYRTKYDTQCHGVGESYGIPYRILTPQGLDNVLVAGRCVSSDRSVQASIRVMPACFITGQAAGVAASMAAEAGLDTRSIDVKDMQTRLIAMGGHLPNAETD